MTTSGADGPRVWDRSAVMDRLGDDADLVAEIVDLVLEDAPPRFAALGSATSPEAIRGIAHALKGCIANIGGDAAAEALLALEQAAAQARTGEFAGLRDRAEETWKALESELRAWRGRP